MPIPIAVRRRAGQVGQWFALLVMLIFCGEALGYAASVLTGTLPPHPAAWGAFVAVALIVGGVATVLLDWVVLDNYRRITREAEGLQQQAVERQELELALASRIEQQRRLRHDLRGALSPILLTADRLVNHADPAVKRAGEIMVRTVDRATALLADSGDQPINPHDGP